MNNNESLGPLETTAVFAIAILGFIGATWLISASIMIPLEYFYKKLGWMVFVLPAVIVVGVGIITELLKKVINKQGG